METNSNSRSRLFIAVPLPDELKQGLGDRMSEWKRRLDFQKWVYPADLHITLFFIGDTDDGKITSVVDQVGGAVAGFGSFSLALTEAGTFGRPQAPSILWLGVGGEIERLRSLQQLVEQAAVAVGYPAESRPYAPHMTIGRKFANAEGASFHPEKLASLLVDEQENGQTLQWTAQSVVLYRTRLGHKPMYETVHEWPLEK